MVWNKSVEDLGRKRLYRSRENRMVAGVCGGLGEYLEIDPTLIRLAWVFLTLAGGFGLIAYFLAVIIMPERGGGEPIEDLIFHLPGLKLLLFLLGTFLLIAGIVQLLTHLIPWDILNLLWWSWPLALAALGIVLILLGLSRTH